MTLPPEWSREAAPSPRWPSAVAVGLVLSLGLLATSLHSFLLFHTLAEMFAIVVGACIFMLAWHTRHLEVSPYLLWVGQGYLCVALLDLVHTLSYKGLAIFPSHDADLPTQLWIAARYLQAAVLLIAPLWVGRRLPARWTLAGLALATALLLAAVFGGWFPACYVEGQGLTAFKKGSEYVISGMLLAAAAGLWARREHFEPLVLRLLLAALGLTIASELLFTFYIGVYDVSNLAGHLCKFVAFYLVYLALVQTNLSRPFTMLFREVSQQSGLLAQSEQRFRTVANHTYDWEMWFSPEGVLLFISPSCQRVTGYTPEEFAAGRDLTADIAHPDDKAALREHYRRHREDGHREEVGELDFRIITKDGRERWISHFCVPVYGDDGQYLGRRVSNRDVTEIKLAEAERERLIGELREALTQVKTLSGLLPICANCKKVRDDQGYWLQIETYISEHSNADFSHGICPQCAQKLYGDLLADGENA